MPILTKSDHELNPASWAYERLAKYIQEFQSELDDEHEVGVHLVSFGPTMVIHIEDLGFHGPDFVAFYGSTQNGERVQLVQHVSQINVLLVAAPKLCERALRIGFSLDKSDQDKT